MAERVRRARRERVRGLRRAQRRVVDDDRRAHAGQRAVGARGAAVHGGHLGGADSVVGTAATRGRAPGSRAAASAFAVSMTRPPPSATSSSPSTSSSSSPASSSTRPGRSSRRPRRGRRGPAPSPARARSSAGHSRRRATAAPARARRARSGSCARRLASRSSRSRWPASQHGCDGGRRATTAGRAGVRARPRPGGLVSRMPLATPGPCDKARPPYLHAIVHERPRRCLSPTGQREAGPCPPPIDPPTQEPAAHRLGDRGRALGDAELLVEVAQVGLDRRRRDLQLAGDLGALAPPAVRSRISCSRGESAGRSSRSRMRTWSASPAWISAARIVWPRATAATVSQITARSASFVRYARTPLGDGAEHDGAVERRGEHDDARRQRLARDRGEHVAAEHARHVLVEDRDVRAQLADLVERRAPVLRRADDLELRALAERADEAVEVDRVVLSDVDGDPRGHDVAPDATPSRDAIASSDRMIRRARATRLGDGAMERVSAIVRTPICGGGLRRAAGRRRDRRRARGHARSRGARDRVLRRARGSVPLRHRHRGHGVPRHAQAAERRDRVHRRRRDPRPHLAQRRRAVRGAAGAARLPDGARAGARRRARSPP